MRLIANSILIGNFIVLLLTMNGFNSGFSPPKVYKDSAYCIQIVVEIQNKCVKKFGGFVLGGTLFRNRYRIFRIVDRDHEWCMSLFGRVTEHLELVKSKALN